MPDPLDLLSSVSLEESHSRHEDYLDIRFCHAFPFSSVDEGRFLETQTIHIHIQTMQAQKVRGRHLKRQVERLPLQGRIVNWGNQFVRQNQKGAFARAHLRGGSL